MAAEDVQAQRRFTAIVISFFACAANAALVLESAPRSVSPRAIAFAWLSGVATAVGIYLWNAREHHESNVPPALAKALLLIAIVIPFILGVIDTKLAELMFGACAGGLVAFAAFTLLRLKMPVSQPPAERPDGT